MPDEGWIILDAAGAILDANAAALDLFGASLDELRAAPPGAFNAEPQSPDEDLAFREAWEGSGKPDIVGRSTLRRKDGATLRVAFGITAFKNGRFLATLRPTGDPPRQRPEVFTAGEVLARWRAAERELQALSEDAPERSGIEFELDRLKDAYQALFRARRQDAGA